MKRLSYSTVSLLLVCACTVWVARTEAQAPGPKKELDLPKGPRNELLNQAVKAMQSNKSRLKTWRGGFIVSDITKNNGEIIRTRRYSVKYCVDQVNDCMRWNREELECIDKVLGVATPDELRFESAMRKKAKFYRTGPISANQHALIRVVPVPLGQNGPLSTEFDPMYYYTEQGGNLEERIKFFYEHSGDFGWHWKSTMSGDLLTVEYAAQNCVNRYVLDLSKGATLAELYYMNRDITGKFVELDSQQKGEYKQINGIWVPVRIKFTRDNKSSFTRTERTVTWADQEVNVALPADSFSEAAMKVRPGEQRIGKDK